MKKKRILEILFLLLTATLFCWAICYALETKRILNQPIPPKKESEYIGDSTMYYKQREEENPVVNPGEKIKK